VAAVEKRASGREPTKILAKIGNSSNIAEKGVTDMADYAVTLAIAGDACTLSMVDPEDYLRIKTYLPRPGGPIVLQGQSDEQSPYPKRASATFPLPSVGEKIRIDVYNGDGEGEGRSAEYLVTENGLEVKQTGIAGLN
jgi:hypothetical protein